MINGHVFAYKPSEINKLNSGYCMLTPLGRHGMNPKPTAAFSSDFRVVFDGFRFCDNFKLEREVARCTTSF